MDQFTAQALNQVVGQSVTFDLIADFIQESYLVKGLFATLVLVCILNARVDDSPNRRTDVFTTLIVIFAAIFLGRVLQMILPFSLRPLHTEGLDLELATGLTPDTLRNDSSFPSDHALMFFAMASSVLLYHRLAGIILMTHAVVIICLPRLVLGFHWFSDIVAGAAIGGLMALLLHRQIARWLSGTRLLDFQRSHPGVFHALLFALLCETATMYRGTRNILSTLTDFLRLA
ncbi:phosphatase PAP2 family protein [Lacimonas salitolerans]|uniref:Phosphatase PAP2 family protein n=1 Tax=Lacimonas salitolerans TaxID=1323750 RepID=A0ABW4ECL5_9RHOB